MIWLAKSDLEEVAIGSREHYLECNICPISDTGDIQVANINGNAIFPCTLALEKWYGVR